MWLVWLLINLGRIAASKPASETAWNSDLLASMSLALTGLSLSRAKQLAGLLTTGAERRTLAFYPLSPRDFFQWAALRFVARSSWIAFAATLICFLASKAVAINGWTVFVADL